MMRRHASKLTFDSNAIIHPTPPSVLYLIYAMADFQLGGGKNIVLNKQA